MKCFFVMWHDGSLGKKGTLRCVLVVHVGGTLGAGDGTSAIVRIELRKQLRFGTWENVQEVEGVFFCGRWTEQRVDFSFMAGTNEYCSKLLLVSTPSTETLDNPLDKGEELELMGCNGRLGWAARHGRPKGTFGMSWQQQSLKGGTSSSWEMIVVNAGDASQGRMPRRGGQQAVAVLLCSPDVLTGNGEAVLIEWASSRVQRVVRSSMACEVAATTFGFEYGDCIRAVLAEVFFEGFNIRRWQSEIGRWPRYVAVDAKTVLDCLGSENTPQDRRVAIDASCLRDHDWTVFTRGNL